MIAMNDYYWNEYIKLFVNDNLLKETLKYHQRTLTKYSKKRNPSDMMVKLCQANEVKKADIIIDLIPLKEITGGLLEVYEEMKKIYLSRTYNVTFPIIINFKNNGGIKKGIYSIDFEQGSLLQYKLIESYENETLLMGSEKNKVIISFFINIEQALALYGERGYINGIEEIGYIVNMLKQSFKTKFNILFLPEQEATHAMGLNVRKCLLIESIGYRG